MESKYKIIDEFIEKFQGHDKEWILEFVQYMREKYPELQEVISFQMPTFKLGSGKNRNYISFGMNKNHFSLHTMDFDYISQLKLKLKSPGNGKGCVNVKFNNPFEKPILFKGIDDIVKRHEKKQ